MLSMDAIVTSLASQAAEELPAGMAIAWPGVQLDTEALSEWIEIWCDAVDGLPQREQLMERREVSVTAHVFVRPSPQTARVFELAEAVRGVFSGRTIPVASEAGVAGVIRLREADMRELTRMHAEEQRRPLRHVVVLIRGIAQANGD
jgi:hypothetical protein